MKTTNRWSLTRVFRGLARFLCTLAIYAVGVYTAISLTVALFLVNGTLTPGDDMWIDSATPSLPEALVFAGLGAAITAGFAYARNKLASKTSQ